MNEQNYTAPNFPNSADYQQELIHIIGQIQNEETLKRIYNLTSYLYVKEPS